MRISFVLAHGQNHFFIEIVSALRDELDAIGVDSEVSFDGFPSLESDTAYVLVPPHEWYALECRRGEPDLGRMPRTLLLCAEQPGTPHFEDNAHLADGAAGVFDISRHGVRELKARGISAEHFQLGWTPRWDVRSGVRERDVDVLFMGCATERRLRHLASYGGLAWRWRNRLLISDNSRPNTAADPGFVVGEEKLALLARSRVLLNLHQGELPYFEWLRAIEAISNGCAIVSEHASDYAPLEAGEHLLLGRPETLGLLAQHLLEDEDARTRMADAAYALLRDELPLRTAVERLANVAERAARAPLPLQRRARRRAPAPRPEDDALARQPADTTRDPAVSFLKAAVKDLRLDIQQLHRHLDENRAAAIDGTPAPELVVDSWSPAWSGARARVSVLTSLFNYGHHIGAALDSVADCEFRDVELIVVDDASVDDSVQCVRDWIAEHPTVPALLLRRPVNRGLPHARNAALGFARGEYAFVLDADNEIYPNSIGLLVEALDADPDAQFAYGMLERFDAHGSIGLVSWQPWDPPRLRTGNYIDAMALLRADVLRSHRGYTTDRRLHGWEDYDLWCRIAESGGRGVLVPEIVARYRVSRHSMLSLTDISSTTAYSVLIERCPRLMQGIRPPL